MKTHRLKFTFLTLAMLALVFGSGSAEAKNWLATAKHPRWDRLYTDLIYQPMLEVMQYLRANAKREYAYGPAQGLPDTKVGTFTQALYDEAKKDGWTVVSMKNDWKRILAFEN